MFHVLKAWLEQLRKKMRNKSRFHEAFKMLHNVVYFQAFGSAEFKAAAVVAEFNKFKQTFADTEPGMIQYLEIIWEKKIGKLPC